jgi:hypothetical protein
MVSKIGRQFGSWRLCKKLEWLGGVESSVLLLLMIVVILFPRLDILIPPATYVALASLSVAFVVAFVEEEPA